MDVDHRKTQSAYSPQLPPCANRQALQREGPLFSDDDGGDDVLTYTYGFDEGSEYGQFNDSESAQHPPSGSGCDACMMIEHDASRELPVTLAEEESAQPVPFPFCLPSDALWANLFSPQSA